MKRYLPFVIVAVVALVTLAAGAMLYQAKRTPIPAAAETARFSPKNSGAAHVRGPAEAPVTLEEFGDFQCPPCGAMAEPLRQIEKEYGPKLRVVFRNFPLFSHQYAEAAACAAEAAGLQGRFWEMHDLLYREQAAWSKAADAAQLFDSYASMLRLDVGRFKRDRDSEAVKARVAADEQRGAMLGVKSTPTLFVNNRQLPSTALNPSGVHEAINDALKENPPH